MGRFMENGVCKLKCPIGFMEVNEKCEIICPVPACSCQSNERCEIEKNKYGCDIAICNCLPGYRKNENNRNDVQSIKFNENTSPPYSCKLIV